MRKTKQLLVPTLLFLSIQVAIRTHAEQPNEAPLNSSQLKLNYISDSKNRIIKFTNRGLEPQVLHMKLEDSIVFYLNATPRSDVRFKIDYGDKPTHCSSSNLKIENGGIVSSPGPLEPDKFATTCFHQRGRYPIEVTGATGRNSKSSGEIIVE